MNEHVCPVCGQAVPTNEPAETCSRCGAMLVALDRGGNSIRSAGVQDQPASRTAKSELLRVARWTLLCSTLGAALGVVVTVAITRETNVLLAAAYFGGITGFFFGFLWSSLELPERKRLWGIALGGGAGCLIGAVNALLLDRNQFLPEVGLLEHFLVGMFIGTVAGLLIAHARSE